MNSEFVPVVVLKGGCDDCNMDVWYIDISKLNLSELIELRDRLKCNSSISVRFIDGFLYENVSVNNTFYRECKKNNKYEKGKLKKRIMKRNYMNGRRKK